MMTTLDKVNWKHGLKTAIAAGVCLGLARVVGLKPGFWACMSTIVVMQSESADTLAASRDRLIGTAVGALVALGVSYFWNGHLIVYALAVLVCMVVTEMMGVKNSGRMAGMTVTIVLLTANSQPHWEVARERFLEVSFGIVVALVVSQVLWRQATVTKTSQG
jgi:uncharacterized membrane protein YgaE (UPF0421/DUF939 family)